MNAGQEEYKRREIFFSNFPSILTVGFVANEGTISLLGIKTILPTFVIFIPLLVNNLILSL